MRAVTTASLVLAVGLFVQACVFPVGLCSRMEAPELSATEEQITRNDVVAVLGEPIETIKSVDGRVDVYEYNGHCAGLMFIGIPIPFFRLKDQTLTVEYGSDGAFLTAQVWPDATTTEIAITLEYETRRRVRADVEKRARAGDPEAMWEYAHALVDAKKSWKWFCLAAHHGLPKAQYHLGNYYRRGYTPISRDVIRAYLWYSLSGARQDFSQIEGINPDQIAEATRLVAEWKANPAECTMEAVPGN